MAGFHGKKPIWSRLSSQRFKSCTYIPVSKKPKTSQETSESDLVRRVFYGRRQGHKLHPKQARLVEDFLPEIRITDLAADPMLAFAPSNFVPEQLVMEIGFGGGEHLAAQAETKPQIGFIGCEPFLNGVAKLLNRIQQYNLQNIRIHDEDARDLIELMPDNCLAGIYLLYPDPWPKKKHHKRRFVNSENLHHLHRLLQPDGMFYFASDIPDYVSWALMHLRDHGGFDWRAGEATDWKRPFEGWVRTRYEEKALAAGRTPTYLRFQQRANIRPGFL